MNFFVRCLSTLIVGLSLSTTLLLCQENVNAGNFLKILNVLDTNRLQQIERALNRKVEDIRTILTGENAKQCAEIIEQLNSIFTSLLPDIASDYANVKNESEKVKNENEKFKNEIKNIKEFVNTVFVPNQVPNSFLCAWILKVGILDDVYRIEQLEFRAEKMDDIFKYADDAAKLKGGTQIITKRQGKRCMTKVEFIDVLKTLAPGLDETLIQNVARHPGRGYEFLGKWCYYHDEVLQRYTAWMDYIEDVAGSPLQEAIISELQFHYKEDWQHGAQKFALTMSRDHFIGNSVKHYFWEQYQKDVILKPKTDFEDLLDSAFPRGWYYTKQSLDHFHLLVQALITDGRRGTNLVLQYEPFLKRPSVGMPQSLACRYSKRDFDYFFAQWSTNTSTPTPKNVA